MKTTAIQNNSQFTRLKNVAEINVRALSATTDDEYALRYLEISNVNTRGIISESAIEELSFIDAPSRAKRIVRSGDTVISSVRPNLQAVAYIDQASDNFIASTGFYVVSPNQNKLHPKYMYYLLLSENTKQYLEAVAKGVGYPAVDDKDFVTTKLLLPSVPEQCRIASYLDKTCAAIDAAIEKKQKQLETLDALRKSIIHKTVTRGLDNSVELKESGVKWLGMIPKHWNIYSFKRVFKVIYRYPTYYDIEYVDAGIPEVRGEALNSDGLITKLESERYISLETNAQFPQTQLEENDLIISVRGTMGKIGLVDKRYKGANITANLLRLSPKSGVASGNFLRWFFMSDYFLKSLEANSPQTTIKTVTMPQLSKIHLLIPSLLEQITIADYLEAKSAEIRRLKEYLNYQIIALEQYRKSLIHECVTGKRRITEEDMRVVQQY